MDDQEDESEEVGGEASTRYANAAFVCIEMKCELMQVESSSRLKAGR